MKQGDEKVDKFLASGMKNVNGWSIGSFFGDRAFYKGDWLMRVAPFTVRMAACAPPFRLGTVAV